METVDRATRAIHTPNEIRPLLERLGIDRFDPWIWMTTKDRLSPELPRFRVHDGGPRRYVPLHPEDAEAFEEYSFEMLGIRLKDGDPYYGLLQFWEDQPTDVRYVLVRWQQSVLYTEYVATRRERDAAIRGAHLVHDAEDRERAWAAMNLIFKGLQRGAPKRKRGPRDPKRREWYLLAQRIGWEAGRAEHKKAGHPYAEWKQITRHK